MFQPVYVVWGLLPAIFVGLAVWTLLRPVFGIHGKESATPFLHTSIFTIFGFVLAIVLDHKLPGMSGLDIVRLLKKKGSPPPIIMISGLGRDDIAVDENAWLAFSGNGAAHGACAGA